MLTSVRCYYNSVQFLHICVLTPRPKGKLQRQYEWKEHTQSTKQGSLYHLSNDDDDNNNKTVIITKMKVIIYVMILVIMIWDSGVGIATSYWLDDREVWVRVLGGGQEFSLLHVVQTGSGVYPTYPVGTGGSFPEVKRPGHEADHSSPTSAEVKRTWVYTSTPLYAFMA
jgi:hypothetical protein